MNEAFFDLFFYLWWFILVNNFSENVIWRNGDSESLFERRIKEDKNEYKQEL